MLTNLTNTNSQNSVVGLHVIASYLRRAITLLSSNDYHHTTRCKFERSLVAERYWIQWDSLENWESGMQWRVGLQWGLLYYGIEDKQIVSEVDKRSTN